MSNTYKKSLIVKKSNELVEAQFRLPVVQQRLLLLIIAQIKPKVPISEKEWYYVDAGLYSSVFELERDGAYKSIAKATDDLAEQWATLLDENGHPKQVRWVISKQYFKNEGRVGFQFHPSVIPFISDLHGRFTLYNIKYISQMKTLYGIPMYELISRRRDKSMQYFPLDTLRKKFGLESKNLEWRDFKRNVIEPAMKDLNTEKGEFDVSWEPVTHGKKVQGINVSYAQKQHVLDEKRGKPPAKRTQKSKANKPASQTARDEAGEGFTPAWAEYGYLTPAEFLDAKRLARQLNFDVTDYEEYKIARAFYNKFGDKAGDPQKKLF